MKTTDHAATDPIAEGIHRALVRARLRAARDAAFAGTRLVVLRNGKIARLDPAEVTQVTRKNGP